MMDLVGPKEVVIADIDGNEHRYIVGKIPYMAGGREVTVDYLTSLQKGNYKRNQELASILFRHVQVYTEDERPIRLTTPQLIDNHIPDIPTGIKVEAAVAEHNLGFSIAGKIREFQQGWKRSTELFNSIISTISRAVSQDQVSQPFTSSEPSTARKTLS